MKMAAMVSKRRSSLLGRINEMEVEVVVFVRPSEHPGDQWNAKSASSR